VGDTDLPYTESPQHIMHEVFAGYLRVGEGEEPLVGGGGVPSERAIRD
jgi:hypothetical protein